MMFLFFPFKTHNFPFQCKTNCQGLTQLLSGKSLFATNLIPVVTSSLKSDSHLLKKLLFICFEKKPFKMMKNAFYFILKALFVLKIFKFLS